MEYIIALYLIAKIQVIITNKTLSRIPSKIKIQDMNCLPFSILSEQGISSLHDERHTRGTVG